MNTIHFNAKKRKNSKGFALIFILVFISMIMGIVGDIVFQTQVSVKSALQEKNTLDAQATALTGIEFAKLLLGMNILAKQYENNPLIPIPKNMYNLLNGQPLGPKGLEKVEEISGINISKAVSPEIQNALSVLPGYFVLNITSENAKLNVNLLQGRYYSAIQKALLRLFSTQDSVKLLDFYDYTPQQIVDNLSIYIKTSVTDGYLQSATQASYDAIGAKYAPKHGALESLEELRRVPGFHIDDIYNVFSPYLTIWPLGGTANTININTAPSELIAGMLTPEKTEIVESEWDKFDDYRSSKSFANEANINTWFQNNLSSYKGNADSEKIIRELFGTTDNIFKVEARGVVHGVEKTLVVVFQQEASGANSGAETTPPSPQPNSGQNNAPKPNDTNATKNTDANKPAQSNTSTNFKVIYSAWK